MSTTAGRLKRHLQECHVTTAASGKSGEPDVAAEVPAPLVASGSSPSASSSNATSVTVENRKKKCRKCEFQTTDQVSDAKVRSVARGACNLIDLKLTDIALTATF